MTSGNGPWGAKSWSYDGVGNRLQEVSTPSGGATSCRRRAFSTTTDVYNYSTTKNWLTSVTRAGVNQRVFTYDGAGNILTDNRSGTTTTYTYNKRNRLASATSGALVWGYTYAGNEQLAIRTLTTGGTDLTHFIHDIFGNVIAETNGTAAGTKREYIYIPETEIAPTFNARAVIAPRMPAGIRITLQRGGPRSVVDRGNVACGGAVVGLR